MCHNNFISIYQEFKNIKACDDKDILKIWYDLETKSNMKFTKSPKPRIK